jgi:hypothetical protein
MSHQFFFAFEYLIIVVDIFLRMELYLKESIFMGLLVLYGNLL